MSRFNSMTAAIRPTASRRRHKLRVVGTTLPTGIRHVQLFKRDGQPFGEFIEVWTYAEWDAIHPSLRPTEPDAYPLPGIGWIRFLDVAGEEFEDACDITRQAMVTEWTRRG